MTRRYHLQCFVVAASLLAIPDSSARGDSAPGFNDVMQAIGMPGSLGIAGMDAMMEFCTGERMGSFRADMLSIIGRSTPARQRDILIRRYDEQYAAWRNGYEKGSRSAEYRTSHCSSEKLASVKDPSKFPWARLAKKIGYPGL